jgi:hypothetical protein
LGIFNTHGDVFGSGSAKHLHSQEANDTAIFLKQVIELSLNENIRKNKMGMIHNSHS